MCEEEGNGDKSSSTRREGSSDREDLHQACREVWSWENGEVERWSDA